jgi:hypothetical protein
MYNGPGTGGGGVNVTQPTKAFGLDRDPGLLLIQAFIRCGRRMPIPCVNDSVESHLPSQPPQLLLPMH